MKIRVFSSVELLKGFPAFASVLTKITRWAPEALAASDGGTCLNAAGVSGIPWEAAQK